MLAKFKNIGFLSQLYFFGLQLGLAQSQSLINLDHSHPHANDETHRKQSLKQNKALLHLFFLGNTN